MPRCSEIAKIAGALVLLLGFSATGPSQTNGLPRSSPPHILSPSSTNNIQVANPPLDQTNADAVSFFTAYRETATFLSRGKIPEAALVLERVLHELRTPPWTEIALFQFALTVEQTDMTRAAELYTELQKRLEALPYYLGSSPPSRQLGDALQTSTAAGINRIRLRRVQEALGRYFARRGEYPESLAKLVTMGYTEMENIHAVNNQLFRYVPQSPRMHPFLSFQRYDLEASAPEPLLAKTPQLRSIIGGNEADPKYTVVIHLPNRPDPIRLQEHQAAAGFFVAAVTPAGVILTSPARIVILLPSP